MTISHSEAAPAVAAARELIDYDAFIKAVASGISGKWPKPTEHYWVLVRENLDRARVTRTEAHEALIRYSADPGFIRSFSRDFLDHVKAIRAEARGGPGGIVSGDRTDAEARSQGCPDCCGGGYTGRQVVIDGYGPSSVSMACICPMGRWILSDIDHKRAMAESKKREVPVRPLDLGNYPSLWITDPDLWPLFWPARPKVQAAPVELTVQRKSGLAGYTIYPAGWTIPDADKQLRPVRLEPARTAPPVASRRPEPAYDPMAAFLRALPEDLRRTLARTGDDATLARYADLFARRGPSAFDEIRAENSAPRGEAGGPPGPQAGPKMEADDGEGEA